VFWALCPVKLGLCIFFQRRRDGGWKRVSKLLSRYLVGRLAILTGLCRSFGDAGGTSPTVVGSLEVGQSIVAEDRIGQSSPIEISDSNTSSNCISLSCMVGSSWSCTLALLGVSIPIVCSSGLKPVVSTRTSCGLSSVGLVSS